MQGWLLYPRDFDPQRRYPLARQRPRRPGLGCTAALAATPFRCRRRCRGAATSCSCPNPRGSFGQGESFTRANVKDFGHGDLRDILAGVDEVLRTAPVDKDRLGIGGWSYGGYMTMWAVTQTHRFRAAVAGAGIANWQSYYGQNGIDQWLIPYFGASVYDDPAIYARSSPINFIKKRQDADLDPGGRARCGMPAAAVAGILPRTEDAEGADEAGRLCRRRSRRGEPAHRRDVLRRWVRWYDAYLQPRDGKGGPAGSPGR